MLSDGESIKLNCDVLTNGWTERVEGRTVYHGSLLGQLHVAAYIKGSPSSEPSCNPNKSESSPPLNMAPMNLIDDISEQSRELFVSLHSYYGEVATVGVKRRLINVMRVNAEMAYGLRRIHPSVVRETGKLYATWVKRARIILNYDQPVHEHPDVSCGKCGGVLVAAIDASTDVRCVSCPNSYKRERWIELL